jgi:D-serine deaminase-like pyridoxal phosphate-dependent protein
VRRVSSAGSKALTFDPGPDAGFGLVLEAPQSASEEHAWVELAGEDELELGQRVRIVPNHACFVVNLYDELHVTRNHTLETTRSCVEVTFAQ